MNHVRKLGTERDMWLLAVLLLVQLDLYMYNFIGCLHTAQLE